MKTRVLAVDDEVDVRNYLWECLNETGFECVCAAGFEEAVRIASASGAEFPILLTDIMLPPFHGRDLANRIAFLHPKIKVVFMSGYAPKMLRNHGLLPPKAEFLCKPFTRSQLLKSLETTHGQLTWLASVSAPNED